MSLVLRCSAYVCTLFVLAIGAASQAAEINWRQNLEAAKREAAQSGKLVLVHFWADWCGPCIRLEKTVFNQPAVAKAIEANYIPVKLHADQYPSLAHAFAVRSLPTDVVISPTGVEVARFATPDERRRISTSSEFTSEIKKVAEVHKPRSESQVATKAASPQVGAPNASPSAATPNADVPPATNPYAGIGPSANLPTGGGPNRTPTPGQPGGMTAATAPNVAPPATQVSPSPHRPTKSRYSAAPAAGGPAANTTLNPATSPTAGPTGIPSNGPPTLSTGQPSNSGPNPPTFGMNGPATSAMQTTTPGPSTPVSPTLSGPPTPTATPSRYSSNPVGRPQVAAPGSRAQVTSPASQAANPTLGLNPKPNIDRSIPNRASAGGNPPLGLDGYCPVSLQAEQRWIVGDRRWGAIHEGRTYLFMGPTQQQQFLADPNRFGPVLSGNDAVLAVEAKKSVPGDRRHGVVFGERVFLFSSEETLARFQQNPDRYADSVRQARQMSHNQLPPR